MVNPHRPYWRALLAELPSEERAEVRRELVSAFFGKPIETVKDDAPTAAATSEQLLDLVRLAIKGK